MTLRNVLIVILLAASIVSGCGIDSSDSAETTATPVTPPAEPLSEPRLVANICGNVTGISPVIDYKSNLAPYTSGWVVTCKYDAKLWYVKRPTWITP